MIWTPLGALPIGMADFLLRHRGHRALGRRPALGSSVRGRPDRGWVLGFYTMLLLAVMATTLAARGDGSRSKIRAVVLWCMLAAWCIPAVNPLGSRGRHGPVEGEILAVGHGLAVVLRLDDGKTLLYDCGRMGDPTVGRRIIAPALWSRGVTRIDSVYLSHADAWLRFSTL